MIFRILLCVFVARFTLLLTQTCSKASTNTKTVVSQWIEMIVRLLASGHITLWQIDEETMETVADFILGVSKITADGDCSQEIK